MKSKLITILPAVMVLLMVSSPAMAQGAEAAAGSFDAIGAGLAVGFACGGAGIGQGRTGASAMEGVARNPQTAGKIQTMMIIALALMESLGIYGFVVAMLLIL